MNTTIASSLAGDLLLVRLLAAGEGKLTPRVARASLGDLLPEPPGAERWQAMLDELKEAGSLTLKPLRLTETGRAQAQAFLGVDRLPPRSNWKTVKARYLVPMALGIPPDAADTHRRIGKLAGMQALLLKRRHGLPVGAGATLNQVLEALACQKLGYAQATTFAEVQSIVLNRLVAPPEPLDQKKLAGQLACRAVKARGLSLNALRAAILSHWSDGDATTNGAAVAGTDGPEGSLRDGTFDLAAFAGTVRAAARHCPSGRFGDNKVFISHVWRHLCQEPGFPRLDLAAFKQRLTEASREGLIHLTRADFVEAMDPADVRDSEIPYLTTTFHFVLIEKEQP